MIERESKGKKELYIERKRECEILKERERVEKEK